VRRRVSEAPDIEILNGIKQPASLPFTGGKVPDHLTELLVSVEASGPEKARARVDAVVPPDQFTVDPE